MTRMEIVATLIAVWFVVILLFCYIWARIPMGQDLEDGE